MPDWIRENTTEAQDEMLLQMDIEGHEYAALEAMSQELLSRFRIIIIELHGLFKFWEPDFHKTMVALRDKLLKDHVTVHLHPNNCCGVFKYQGVGIPRALEITLIKKDYVETKGFAKEFPHPLDQDNTALGHIKLPKDWIRV